MSQMIASQLRTGRVFGDREAGEYVYMPAGEVGLPEPLFIFENGGRREDVPLAEALRLIRVLSLRPVRHPRLGEFSC